MEIKRNKLIETRLTEAKTRRQAVMIQEHMLDYFDGDYENLMDEIISAWDRGYVRGLRELVEGGCFACYSSDARDFLTQVYETPDSDQGKYSEKVVWERYVNLLAMEMANLHANPNGGGKNYLKSKIKESRDYETFICDECNDTIDRKDGECEFPAPGGFQKGIVSLCDECATMICGENYWEKSDDELRSLWVENCKRLSGPEHHYLFESEKPYAVRYRMFQGKAGWQETKEKEFATEAALEKFMNKIEEHPNFSKFVAVSYPKDKND